MSLGRHARRSLPAVLAATLAATAGCGLLPYSIQILPRETAVKTGLEGEMKAVDDRSAPYKARNQPPANDHSPLPPALDRPESPGLPPMGPTSVVPAPPRDEAVTRAGAEQASADADILEGVPSFKELEPPAGVPNKAPKTVAAAPLVTISASSPEPSPVTTPPPPTPPVDVPPQVQPPSVPAPTPETPPVVIPSNPPDAAQEPSRTPATTPPPLVEAAKPEETWRDNIKRMRALSRAQNQDARPGSPDWARRERLLAWLEATENGAAQPGSLTKGVVTVLDPGATGAARSAEIREAVDALESEVPLEVAVLKLCRKVTGFGDIETLDPPTRHAGQPVILYCEIIGLTYEAAAGQFHSRLSADLDLIPPGSETPAWSRSLGTVEDTCRRRRRDYYANYKFTLPENLPAGEYRLRIREKDLATGHIATAETSLTITH